MTKILYWSHPTEMVWKDAYVIATGRDDYGLWVELNETIAHIRGGGQLADRGMLNDMKLIDVQKCRSTGIIRHYVDKIDGLREGSDIEISIDSDFRRQNSILHSSGHLLGRIVEKLYPTVIATNGHHYPGECRVDFTGPSDIILNTEDINNEISQSLLTPIDTITFIHPDGSRYVKIGDYEKIGCGGTHVESNKSITSLIATKVKNKNGMIRVSYSAT